MSESLEYFPELTSMRGKKSDAGGVSVAVRWLLPGHCVLSCHVRPFHFAFMQLLRVSVTLRICWRLFFLHEKAIVPPVVVHTQVILHS